MKRLFQKGFTLIELLVVIAIMGVLSAAVVTAINPLSKINQAKDSQIKGDIAQISTALQSYYTLQNPPAYPATLSTLVPNELKQIPVPPGGGSYSTNYSQNGADASIYYPLTSQPGYVWCWSSKTAQPQAIQGTGCDANGGAITPTPTPVPPTPTPACPYTNLFAYWPLDGNTIDSISLVSATAVNASPGSGRIGQAYSFNGTNAYINAGNLTTPTSAITVAGWVKGASGQNQGVIVSKYDYFGTPGNRSWQVSTQRNAPTSNKFEVVVSQNGDLIVAKDYVSSIAALDNSWHHVAFTFSSNTLKLYVNGAEDTNPTKSVDATVNLLKNASANVGIGSMFNNGSASQFFNGSIDDVRIYNRVLTAGEISALAGLSSTCP